MRSYELVLVFSPSITESERKKVIETAKKWLASAKIEKASEWGKKAFIRPIKKATEGFFILLDITSDDVIPKDLDKRLQMESKILRHLLVRK